ncbi:MULTISPECIES: hypothetical protein [unclassified Agromyces]|uniref:hypothetical protein n=1 Tax=unclassified Agromyces TaxID=2639701 RepID=UPI003014C1D5
MAHHDDERDERMARLQRLAYGAGASEEERTAAAAELAALQESSTADREGPGVLSAPADRPEPGVAAIEPMAPQPGAPPVPAVRSGERSRVGAVLAAATAALVAGGVVGWALGSTTEPSEGADVGIPVAETAAWEVFDRPVTEGDFVRYPAPLVDIDADDTTRRLLLTRSDGVQLVAVRTSDGEDACLVLAVPVGRPATACTEDGLFPGDGLMTEISVQGVGVYLAGWDPDGSARINTAAAPTD